MATTPISGLRYKDLTDIPDANALSQDLATDLDHVVRAKYGTTTDRDAHNIFPLEGDTCHVAGTGTFTYNGTKWLLDNSMLGWKTYTPVWTTSTGSHIPSLGNGTNTFRWMQINSIVLVSFLFTAGSTTSYNSGTGSDNWTWSLPPHVGTAGNQNGCGFADAAYDGTGNHIANCRVDVNSASTFAVLVTSCLSSGSAAVNTGYIDAITPATWTTGANMDGFLQYAVS